MTAPGGPLVLAHLSDLHLGAHDPGAVASVAADVAAVRPALTVVTGDCTMRARAPEFRLARDLLDRLPRPLLVVPGNHDLPLVSLARLAGPYRRYRRWISAELDPVVRLPGLTALGLQSTPAWRWKSGRISRRQSAAVRSVLGAAPAGDVRLLALHHPPRAPGLARLAGGRRLLRSVAAAHVDLLLVGHTHIPESHRAEQPQPRRAELSELRRAEPRRAEAAVSGWAGVIEVVAGTATSLRTRGAGRSWTVIRVSAESVAVEERRQTAAGWRTDRTTTYPRCT
jgi:3',5'-cyclic AMP phosphodiesterase CpdA